jgi:hypothetical protein
MINSFTEENRFLSNFWSCAISHDGIQYPSVEHAFQAAETLNFDERLLLSKCTTPAAVKRRGRIAELRPYWEIVKVEIMRELLIYKFVRHDDLRALLLDTGDQKLIEGNYWEDTFWGVCRGKGENVLGELLMWVRNQLQ